MEFLKVALPWVTVGLFVLVIAINHVKSRKHKKDGKESEGKYMIEGMCLGLCVGLAFGSECPIHTRILRSCLIMKMKKSLLSGS